MRIPFGFIAALIVITALAASVMTFAGAQGTRADEGWVIRSLNAQYSIDQNGTLNVSENILVDFGSLQRHGIFRDVPIEYRYEPESGGDTKQDRLVTIDNVSVDDGATPRPFTTTTSNGVLQIKIGDPDVLVSGEQRYRIQYRATGALNPFENHDELFWNVSGNDWPVPIQQASAKVLVPTFGIDNSICYQGEAGSKEFCLSNSQRSSATFSSTRSLGEREGMTIVVGLQKGVIDVPPLVLVSRPKAAHTRSARDFIGPSPLTFALGGLLSIAVVGLVGYQWWRIGRDRWYGDTYYLSEDAPHESTKPPFAHQTIVVEYTPPEVGAEKRRLHPAEIGLLLDERADTLDVSATIVDLAVRKYLTIQEASHGGIFVAFKSADYTLSRLEQPAAGLLPYESLLLEALFAGGATVQMSELKGKFHDDLQEVKSALYLDSVKQLKLFPRDPSSVRTLYQGLGIGVIVAGALVGVGLGYAAGAALVALPIIVGGAALMLLAPAMPCRSALGWETFRRCLGFRLYMVTAETDRQRFAEQANIFHEYLPYAIVYGCVTKWANAFEGLDLQAGSGYYVGASPFEPLAFAAVVNSFSGSVTSVMAATPGGSGGSGFSGGGFSGGGVGGGGGGSW